MNAILSGKLPLVLWALYLILFPFYLLGRTSFQTNITWAQKFTGGVPQPADFLMLFCMVPVFAGSRFRPTSAMAPVIYLFGLFVLYVTLINAVWSTWLETWSIWSNTLFYVYDYFLLLMFLILFSKFKDALLYTTVHAVAASVFFQVMLSPLSINPSWERQLLFFHNENQLGYYVLLSSTIFYLGTRSFPIKPGYQLCYYASVLYLVLLSASKAAIGGLAFLLVLAFFECSLNGIIIGLVLGGALFVIVGPPLGVASKAEAVLESRLSSDRTDDTLEGRGYDRIVNHPGYLLLGAGEGAYQRFRSVFNGELHSSFGTLLFCYGIPGVLLFIAGLWYVCLPKPALVWFLGPPVIYGFAHQGVRYKLFWVFLAFICCLAKRPESTGLPPQKNTSWDGSSA